MKDGASVEPHVAEGPPSKPVPQSDTAPCVLPAAAVAGGSPPTVSYPTSDDSAPNVADVGRPFGDYELQEKIAHGGMGVVYRARHKKLNRSVALKMIRAGQLASEEEVKRFYREAQAAAQLDHPGIVPIYEVGDHQGQHFFSMGLVEGGNLQARLQDGPLAPHEAAHLTARVAEAVAYAHQCGVVHRDLKPSNVLLDRDGRPRVTDFGLAKQLQQLQGTSEATASGQILGTPGYMPPEQAAGKTSQVGAAADIYALGALLYCLITGRPPFQAAGLLETLRLVREQEPVPPRQLNAGIPRDLETICLKCLQKEPKKRYETARALADDLTRFHEGRPIVARPVGRLERGWRWCRRNPVGAGLMLSVVAGAAVAVGLSIWAVGERNRADDKAKDEAKARADVESRAAETRRQIERLHVANGLRLDDEGDLLAAMLWFSQPFREHHGPCELPETHELRLSLYWRYAAGFKLRRLSFRQGAIWSVVFSRDGRWLLTASGDEKAGEVRVLDISTGQPVGPPLKLDGAVRHAAFSPDGRWILTAADGPRVSGTAQTPGTAQVWEATTGRPVSPPLKHPDSVRRAAFSPDGRWVLTTGGADHCAQVWEARTGQPVGPPIHKSVSDAAFSPDGRWVATASGDKTAWVWDATTGKPIAGPLKHPFGVSRVAFSPDGQWLVTVSQRIQPAEVRVWEAASGRPVSAPLKHKKSIHGVVFSPDGRWLLTAGHDDETRVWEAESGRPVGPPLKHPYWVHEAAFSPDGRWALTAGSDGTARLWDAATARPLYHPLKHQREARYAAFSPEGRRLVTASNDGEVRLWEAADGQDARAPLKHPRSVIHAEFSPDGRWVLTGDGGLLKTGAARVWDTTTGQPVGAPMEHRDVVGQAAFSPDSRRVVTASFDGSARVWDAATGTPISPPLKHRVLVRHAAFSPDGRWVVTASDDGSAQVWEADSGQPVSHPLRHRRPVYHAAFSPDGRRVVTASGDGVAQVWEAATGKPAAPPIKQDALGLAAFSPDGNRIVTVSSRRGGAEARVWDVASGQPVSAPMPHQEVIRVALFSPDGQWVLTASHDKSARVWDAKTGLPVSPPLVHQAQLNYAAFSPDGRWVATASVDKTARVWEAVSGQAVSPPLRHEGWVNHVAFAPDGAWLVTASSDGTARLWNLTPDRRSPSDWLMLTQVMHGHRLDKQGALVPLPREELEVGWQTLRDRYPQDFSVSAEQALAWHRRQAVHCLQQKNPRAYLLHAWRGHWEWPVLSAFPLAGR